MSLEIQRVALTGHPISAAYVTDHERVARFYLTGPPDQAASYREVAERASLAYPESRWKALAEAVRPTDPRVGKRLEEVIRARGLFVATGQQAGLFTGPLLTIYKALTAARLAADLEEQLAVPVMPLFTVASEDHDWDEVNHAHVIDLENRLLRLEVSAPSEIESDTIRPPVFRVPVGPGADAALGQLGQVTPHTEFKSHFVESLRSAYRPDRSMADAFEVALTQLLTRYPFLPIQASHPFVKETSRQLLWNEWEMRTDSTPRLAERAGELRAEGFPLQVKMKEGLTNLFVEGALGRDRVQLDERSGARLRRSGEVLSADELRHTLESAPDRVSPGVLLRPVAEAVAFPVVAYVAGPAEIAYLAQSQPLFDLHGVPAPVVVPRASFQLVEPKIDKVLKKYALEAADLAGDSAGAINRLLKDQMPLEVADALEALRAAVAAGLRSVESAALARDPGSQGVVGRGKRAIFQGIEVLERKLGDRVKDQHQLMRQQLEKVAVHMYPGGDPQERILNIYPYVIRYGESLLEAVYERADTLFN